MAVTIDEVVLGILDAHPDGLTKDELFEKVQKQLPGIRLASIQLGKLAIDKMLYAQMLVRPVPRRVRVFFSTGVRPHKEDQKKLDFAAVTTPEETTEKVETEATPPHHHHHHHHEPHEEYPVDEDVEFTAV